MRIYKVLFIVVICIILNHSIVFAETTYKSYIYNVWGEAVPTPSAYVPRRFFIGNDFGVGTLNNPQDFVVDRIKNEIYIADSGNNRIIVLDLDYNPIRVIDKLNLNGNEDLLNNPTGLYVTADGRLFIADQNNSRIVVTDGAGNIQQIIGEPESDILTESFNFVPEKVAVDSYGMIYVQSYGMFQGLLLYNEDGSFSGYYGSNRVEVSLQLISDLFWRRFFTREQRDAMARYVPIEYSNVFVCSDDFKYVTVRHSQNSVDQIRKLNNQGINVLRFGSHASDSDGSKSYGDADGIWIGRERVDSKFVDIHVDDEGFISILDATRGRIFQFDQESNLIAIFGGRGSQVGTFKGPVAIDKLGEKILVLDSEKGGLTEFVPTSFGHSIREAILLYNEGFYEEAVVPWQEVIKRSVNYELAYVGIGKALYSKGTVEGYKEAMRYFKLGNDREGYSDAFRKYSTEVIRDKFGLIVLGLVLLPIFFMLIKNRERFGIKLKQMRGEN